MIAGRPACNQVTRKRETSVRLVARGGRPELASRQLSYGRTMTDAKPEHIFEGTDELWQELHRAASRASHASWIPPEIMPDDPSMN